MPKQKPIVVPRKPPPIAAEDFIAGETKAPKQRVVNDNVNSNVNVVVKTSTLTSTSFYQRRSGSKELAFRMTVYVPSSMAKALKARAAKLGCSMSDIVVEAVQKLPPQ